jgi:hypothetical protein
MGAQHTPGPWEAAYGADGYYAVYSNGDQELSHDTQANCDLIAAAPDLLEALARLLAEVEEHSARNGWVGRGGRDAARAAIAKAKGEA